MLPASTLLYRISICISGCVQGVGFRPFVFNLANKYSLKGYVKNTSAGVEINVEGNCKAIDAFQNDLISQKPQLAWYEKIQIQEMPPSFFSSFIIDNSSVDNEVSLALLPDTAICDICKSELVDPSNRRYKYPFIHCMGCGPRFSLFESMPFDRKNTTMKDFTPCDTCLKEYTDSKNRRFFSQTICCSECGPKLTLYDKNQNPIANEHEAIKIVKEELLNGKIVAIKNTGGFLLLCNATNESCVQRLRSIKKRTKKPFAVLAHSLDSACALGHIGSVEEKALTSYASPITLCKKKENSNIAPSVCSESPYVGIMLPSTALLLLLTEDMPVLVATSGNISSMPLCIYDSEVFSTLSECDFFLSHNRKIASRIDDSVVHIINECVSTIRRARGYIPSAFSIPNSMSISTPILSSGCDLKNSFALASKNKIYLSQYIGDLSSLQSISHYQSSIEFWKGLLSIKSHLGVCDIHPDMITTKTVQSINTATAHVQHHTAHLLANQLENNIPYPYLGVVWDGTGLGDDHTVWGGEFFEVTEHRIQRIGSMESFPLPGGDKAVKEPRRSCLGALTQIKSSALITWAKQVLSDEEVKVLSQCISSKINTPMTSSIGRLFDAAASLLNICHTNEFEGHAAILLEKLALNAKKKNTEYVIPITKKENFYEVNALKILNEMYTDKKNGVPLPEIAYGFHLALARIIRNITEIVDLKRVALSGGVMQNKLLVELTHCELNNISACVYIHKAIPTNDQGIAAGQLLHLMMQNQHHHHL